MSLRTTLLLLPTCLLALTACGGTDAADAKAEDKPSASAKITPSPSVESKAAKSKETKAAKPKAKKPEKFEQTWSKDYADTTCSEWNDDMNQHETFVAAADMLVSARNTDGGDELPSDNLIKKFRDGLTTACVIPDESLATIGSLLYLTEKATFKP